MCGNPQPTKVIDATDQFSRSRRTEIHALDPERIHVVPVRKCRAYVAILCHSLAFAMDTATGSQSLAGEASSDPRRRRNIRGLPGAADRSSARISRHGCGSDFTGDRGIHFGRRRRHLESETSLETAWPARDRTSMFLKAIGLVSITRYHAIDALLVGLWIVGLTNAFNLLDNINGLCGGTAVLVDQLHRL